MRFAKVALSICLVLAVSVGMSVPANAQSSGDVNSFGAPEVFTQPNGDLLMLVHWHDRSKSVGERSTYELHRSDSSGRLIDSFEIRPGKEDFHPVWTGNASDSTLVWGYQESYRETPCSKGGENCSQNILVRRSYGPAGDLRAEEKLTSLELLQNSVELGAGESVGLTNSSQEAIGSLGENRLVLLFKKPSFSQGRSPVQFYTAVVDRKSGETLETARIGRFPPDSKARLLGKQVAVNISDRGVQRIFSATGDPRGVYTPVLKAPRSGGEGLATSRVDNKRSASFSRGYLSEVRSPFPVWRTAENREPELISPAPDSSLLVRWTRSGLVDRAVRAPIGWGFDSVAGEFVLFHKYGQSESTALAAVGPDGNSIGWKLQNGEVGKIDPGALEPLIGTVEFLRADSTSGTEEDASGSREFDPGSGWLNAHVNRNPGRPVIRLNDPNGNSPGTLIRFGREGELLGETELDSAGTDDISQLEDTEVKGNRSYELYFNSEPGSHSRYGLDGAKVALAVRDIRDGSLISKSIHQLDSALRSAGVFADVHSLSILRLARINRSKETARVLLSADRHMAKKKGQRLPSTDLYARCTLAFGEDNSTTCRRQSESQVRRDRSRPTSLVRVDRSESGAQRVFLEGGADSADDPNFSPYWRSTPQVARRNGSAVLGHLAQGRGGWLWDRKVDRRYRNLLARWNRHGHLLRALSLPPHTSVNLAPDERSPDLFIRRSGAEQFEIFLAPQSAENRGDFLHYRTDKSRVERMSPAQVPTGLADAWHEVIQYGKTGAMLAAE